MALGIRGPVTPEQLADLARIRRSKDHLLSIITDLLGFARADREKLQQVVLDVAADKADYQPLPRRRPAFTTYTPTPHVGRVRTRRPFSPMDRDAGPCVGDPRAHRAPATATAGRDGSAAGERFPARAPGAAAPRDVPPRRGAARRYSPRSAVVGATRVARSAGTRVASAATPTSSSATAPNVAGSAARTP
jgi:hypothetical protein